jgi:hypothetical protein
MTGASDCCTGWLTPLAACTDFAQCQPLFRQLQEYKNQSSCWLGSTAAAAETVQKGLQLLLLVRQRLVSCFTAFLPFSFISSAVL